MTNLCIIELVLISSASASKEAPMSSMPVLPIKKIAEEIHKILGG